MSCLRFPGDKDYWEKASKCGKLVACQLAERKGRKGRGRTTDGTHWNTVGAKELHVRSGDFLEGFNEPTSAVGALAPLSFKSVFTKSWGN